MIASLFFLTSLAAMATPTAGSPDPKEGLSMRPKFVKVTQGRFLCEPPPALLVGRSISGVASPLADALSRLRSRLGCGAPAEPKKELPGSPTLLIGLPNDHAELKRIIDRRNVGANDYSPLRSDEAFVLEVTPKRILLTAEHAAGIFRGIQRLTEQISENGIPCGTTVDWPELGWRGMHVLVSGHSAMPNLKRLIADELPALRLNHLILEINYNFAFRSRPELVGQDALTVEDCRELRKLADRSFVEITPMLNCLGHQSWDKETYALLRTHPEFDETPEVPADNKGIYCRSWCPSNPDVNRVVFALIDELIDAFQAKSFHVGMDEVFLIGKCPRCKDHSPAALFATAVKDLHAHLVGQRHVQMQMWGDRLLDGVETKYGEWEASKNGTSMAIELIPKDIVICDWHYETPADFPSIPLFQQKGYRTIPSGWNQVENIKLLTASAFRHRGPRLIGYLATTWEELDTVVRGLAGEAVAAPDPQNKRKKQTDLPAAIRLGARLAWEGPEQKRDDHLGAR